MAAERSPFRPDVEGLRGLAILLVVLFHAGVSALSGGFVGVDVFFVLSGFFITGMLAREVERTGEVRVGEFYARRSLRVLPPFLVVLVATLAAVTWLYAPIDRAPIASAARAVALGVGNVEFARGAVDYFSSGENPLLHTWSLAVEQQFYAVWPLLVAGVALLHDDHAPVARTRRPLLAWIGVVGILSFAASVVVTRAAQPWAFFGLPTRLWELALGGAVALALDEERRDGRGVWIQAAGLVAIGLAIALYDRSIPYPGAAALLPAAGAVALLAGGGLAPASAVSGALAAAPLRWLGRLSYAWYLWHWPLVGLAAVLRPSVGVGGKLAWSAAALGLAWLTHRFIETPAREGKIARAPARALGTLALVASVGAALLAHLALRAAERAVAHPAQRTFAAARVDRMQPGCWAKRAEAVQRPCLLGDRGATTRLALLGDSHAEHWSGALDRAGRERGWAIDAMVMGGCPVADMAEQQHPRLRRHYRECSRYREAMLRRIVAMRPDAVILSSWDHYLPRDGGRSTWQVTPAMWRDGLRRTYARLTAAGLRVIVIRDVPQIPFDAPACLSRRAAGLPFAFACEYDRATALSPLALAAQNEAARGLPVRFVDMNDAVCATARCPVTRDGVVVFTDDNHLTATFSRAAGGILGARLAEALRR